MIVRYAVLNGAEDWGGDGSRCRRKEAWLRGFLELLQGIPSHNTLSDVLGRIEPTSPLRARPPVRLLFGAPIPATP